MLDWSTELAVFFSPILIVLSKVDSKAQLIFTRNFDFSKGFVFLRNEKESVFEGVNLLPRALTSNQGKILELLRYRCNDSHDGGLQKWLAKRHMS